MSIVKKGRDAQGQTVWLVRPSLGVDPVTGKYIRKNVVVHGTKRYTLFDLGFCWKLES